MHTIKKLVRSCIPFFIGILLAATAYSQPYEIRAVNKGMGLIGVEMRVTGGTAPVTTDFITDILFGIRWSAAHDIDLSPAFSTLYNIHRSGTRALKGSFYFQTFYAESVPFNVPANWVVNNWTEILSISQNGTGTGTGPFEIIEAGFDPSSDPNIGINLVDYSPRINGSADETILPVKLATFEAIPGNRSIKIQWSTVNEQNSKGFEVQRAEFGNNQLSRISWVDSKAKSSGNQQYEFIDRDVSAKVKYSYRINQVDYDGRSTYSPLKTVILNDTYQDPVNILPNPVSKTLQVLLNFPANEEVVLRIVDIKGSVIQTRKEFAVPGKKVELNTSGLMQGQYFVIIQHPDGSVTSRPFQKIK